MEIQIGQRIHCGLYGGRNGIVFEITGTQKPETIYSVARSAIVAGGAAEISIVFDNDTISRRIPEAVIRGVQWEILWTKPLATKAEIADRVAAALAADRNRQTAEVERQMQLEARRRELREKFGATLQPVPEGSYAGAKQGAANMRRELKQAFPGTKFSVTSDIHSIRISWNLGPTTKQVEEVTSKYQRGSFNGMEDIYENDRNNVFPEIFGGAKYVSCSRHMTPEVEALLSAAYREAQKLAPDAKTENGSYIEQLVYAIFASTPIPAGATVTGIRPPTESERSDYSRGYYRVATSADLPAAKPRLRYNQHTGQLEPAAA